MSIIRMLLLLLITVAFACGTAEQAPRQEKQSLAAEAPAAVEVRESMLVSADWLSARLEDENVIVLHVATSAENYEAGHVPGARYLGWEQLAQTVDGVLNELPAVEALTELFRGLGIDKSKRVVIYDEESGYRAARVYFTLNYLGLGRNSSLLDGQLAHWRAGGLPLRNESPKITRSDFEPVVNERIVIRMNELLALINEGARQKDLLDCRPPDQFSGVNPGKKIDRGGHIPDARNLPAMKTVISAEEPLFLPPAELRKVYEQAGCHLLPHGQERLAELFRA